MADAEAIRGLLDQRILVLDGAWGTMLQGAGLAPRDYRGEIFGEHPHDVAGDPDILNLTRPDLILGHPPAVPGRRRGHHHDQHVHRDQHRPGGLRPRGVGPGDEPGRGPAGPPGRGRGRRQACGGLGRAAERHAVAVAAGRRPGVPAVGFDQVYAAYAEQMAALAEGGVDLLLIETIFDTLNAKAAIAAAREVAPGLPLWISVTIVDLSGRTLSGQTVEAFWTAIEHAEPLIVGVNCSLGAAEMRPHVERPVPARRHLRQLPPERRACPTRSAATTSSRTRPQALLRGFAEAGLVNVVGGCCGTTPAHIEQIAAAVAGLPRAARSGGPRPASRFSGLEPFEIGPDTGFVMIGERTNVAGSARFRRLIEAGDNQAAVDVALEQVRGGANLLDVNMDADLLDGEQAMTSFLNFIATEPEVARIPVMIDSSRWSGAGGRAEVRAGQGRGQLDQPEGGRGRVPRPGPADP